MKDGEPWFVAKDVTDVPELKSAKDSTKYLDDDEKDKVLIKHSGSDYKSEMIVVSESGLYSLILRSRKPRAKAFKKWVTNEVLPTIRKHGAYMTENTLQKVLTSPDFLIELVTNLKNEQEARKLAEFKVAEQQEVIEVLEPKAEYHDNVLDSTNSFTITEIKYDSKKTKCPTLSIKSTT
ncbi:hypothetical protein COE51_21385 [Bacillus pseudomycoides]|nr:hypothetical protein COE51_21385 [Bacillus pseudomycoides]